MMFKDLLLHAKTSANLQNFLQKPSHALILSGLPGTGKEAVARDLTAQLLKTTLDRLENYPYFYLIEKPDDKQDISIDSVRGLVKKINLKPVLSQVRGINTIVFIKDAHFLSSEAQNALLKIIEEPPSGTVFVLTTISAERVLPTIASRAQKINIVPVRMSDAKKYFDGKYPEAALESAWQLSQGAAGLLIALLQDDSNHPLKQAVDTAKRLLQMNRYERVLLMDSLSSNKQQFILTLDALSRVLNVLHHSAIHSASQTRAKKIMTSRKLVNRTIETLQKNTSARLAGLNLALRLSV